MENADTLFEMGGPAPEPVPARVYPMTSAQRDEIRALLHGLGATDARTQFDMVDDVLGTRLTSVADLTAAQAQTLITRLQSRLRARHRTPGASSWDSREEDTWIDKL